MTAWNQFAQSFAHIKPWSRTYSDPVCGCLHERGRDGGYRYFPCFDCLEALMQVRARKKYGSCAADRRVAEAGGEPGR